VMSMQTTLVVSEENEAFRFLICGVIKAYGIASMKSNN